MSPEDSKLVQFNEIEKAGKLHKKLLVRLYVLGLIAAVVLGIIVYDVAWKGLSFLPMLAFAAIGFVLGFFIFTHMNKIGWDEAAEVVRLERFDKASFALLLLYIAYRVSVEFFLKHQYDDALFVSGASLAVLFGGLFGRFLGMVYAVARVHKENA